MKRFLIVGQVEDGQKLEELTNHVSKALKEFESEHGLLTEADVQIVVGDIIQEPLYTDGLSIGFHPSDEDEDDEYFE
jgi:hypothetical protein